LTDDSRALVRAELADPSEPMPWALIRLALSSPARLAVVPAQDLLALGSEARMNTPGVTEGNWSWRATSGAFSPALATRLRELVESMDRSG
jgi:4-alpha-glucanotransferase